MPWRFGQKLRYLRARSSLTQAALALRLHLASHAHIAVRVEYLVREELPPQAADEQQYQRGSREGLGVRFFGPNLARLRVQAGLTQVQLAEQLDLAAHAHVSFLESGRKQPSMDLVLRVVDYFGVTADQLFSAPV
jgi:transcriptional regulator with XRE-family HTH domain